jgi:flagellar basal-body rod protein FlgC
MMSSISLALGGISAQTRRLDASASNTANQLSAGALPDASGAVPAGMPQAYRPVDVAQSAQATANGGPGGTRATFTSVSPAILPQYSPDSPFANADGMIGVPNVDEGQETVRRMTASRAYGANLAVMQASDEMTRTVLNAKA